MTTSGDRNRAAARRDSTKPWFDAARVAEAVAGGHNTVVIKGIRFTIERGHHYTGPASGVEYELALLRREDGGFAPMGYVRLPDA